MDRRKNPKRRRVTLWLHALLLACMLLSSPGVLLAQDETEIFPAPAPGTTRPDVTPGAVELLGPDPQPLQPVDPGSITEQVRPLYLPFVAQDPNAVNTSATLAPKSVDMKLLVLAADGQETDYPYIRAYLDQIGIPYDVVLSASQALTPNMLSDGADRGYYQGVILTTGNLGYVDPATGAWASGLDWAEWNTLWQYEAAFKVRQVTSYTYPGGWPDSYGLNYVTFQNTVSQPLTATFTPAGKQVFADLNTNNPVTFKNSWVYLATIANTAVTTPLLTTSAGHVIASIHNYPDGRQNLAITTNNNPYLIHSLQLSYGTINWLTKGLFLGYRKVWINPQVDDLLIDSDMWDIAAQSDTTGKLFRLSGTDFTRAVAWQNTVRNTYPLAASLTLEWAFNGEGSTGIYFPDTLTSAVRNNQAAFTYVNHTYTHANLDSISYTSALNELRSNHNRVPNLRFTRYFSDTMVQPDISGLNNAEFFRAARDFGMKYMISDTSRPGGANPTPNTGFYSQFQPSVLIIPRRPTNLFYNLSTPAEWVSEYNCFYGPQGICAGGQFRYWDRNLTYHEILDKESDMLIQYLLKWDIDPWMFHQANVKAFDSVNSILGDLLRGTMYKYTQLYNVPVTFITQHDIGVKMAERMAYNASGVRATLIPCQSITLSAVNAARIPLTGIAVTGNVGAPVSTEVYARQNISYITLSPGQTVTLPAPACN